ncbi:MAG: ankyrin repeat domain-containing protein [Endomicrobiaceae bacterium]|jgi:ankyrin repeat protein|nr:ankyrin repeat domain-containing protein [Endomicrobiaceae bacterium]MDD3729597.1 ankyrin repeat domain-containing protein [Endomicrobiaceae bacterium]MDD4165690.1 ankyrin repeat domain-containing protein [Endomicrobiaceae bacterium]
MKIFIKSVFLFALFLFCSAYLNAETFQNICKDGSLKVVMKAVKEGGDVNGLTKDLQTPLMQASKYNNPEVVQFLIEAGAGVNAKDEKGRTALMYACEENRNVEVVNVLTRKRADVNAADNEGKTALMYACESNPNIKITAALVEAGADVKAKTKTGLKPLDYAEKNENKKSAALIKTILLQAGAASQDLSDLEKI